MPPSLMFLRILVIQGGGVGWGGRDGQYKSDSVPPRIMFPLMLPTAAASVHRVSLYNIHKVVIFKVDGAGAKEGH